MDSSGKLADTYSVMEFDGADKFRNVVIHQNNRVLRNDIKPWDFVPKKPKGLWVSRNKNKEYDMKNNMIGLLDEKRQKLYKRLLSKHEEPLKSYQIIKILKKELKNKKKDVLKVIQDNRSLEYKWKKLNIKLQNVQQSQIDQFEYLKKLIVRDKNQLKGSEFSIVSNINDASKQQIKNEISKILSHETQFVSFDQNDNSTSNIKCVPDENKKYPITKIYSD